MEFILFQVGRVLLQIHLLAVFFNFFGLPAIQRFKSREVSDNLSIQDFSGDGGHISQVMVLKFLRWLWSNFSGDGGQDEKGH